MSAHQEPDLDTAGMLQLNRGERRFVGPGRIELLRRIEETGSITRAARAMGMSYKHAWDAVDAMNNLAAEPLVQRQTGGRHGGGTTLTDAGRRLIAVYDAAAAEHRRFLARLRAGVRDFERFDSLMGVMSMKVSARNLLRGVVARVRTGAVNAEVELDLNGTPLVAIVTNQSVESLGLAEGMEAYALIKASFVLLATADGGLRTSARNRLCGTVARVSEGAVNAEVVLSLDGGAQLTAVVTLESLRALELAPGAPACALIKAPHVILAVQE